MTGKQHDNEICLVTALCDPDGELLKKAESNWDALRARFCDIAVHLTHDTHDHWRDFLQQRAVTTAEAEPGLDFIGLHRRRAVKTGLVHSAANMFLYVDIDHVLRWVERQPDDLDNVLLQLDRCDCLVIGRTETGFDLAPERLRATEVVVNHIYRLATGRSWDLMMAARGLSRQAAELVVRESSVDTLANDVEWPSLLEQRGMTLDYVQADGLTYEIDSAYAETGIDNLDGDPEAWMIRVRIANQHVEVMKKFLVEK